MNLRPLYFFSAGLLTCLSGCLNLDPKPDPTRYFTLSPGNLAETSSGLVEVEVSELPYYAQTKRIPVRVGGVEIVYLDFDRWTGPLDVMLAARLRERLDLKAVDRRSGAWHVAVKVLACEGLASGGVRFGADYSMVRAGNPDPVVFARFQDAAPWDPDSGAAVLAEQLGVLVDALGDRMATVLAEDPVSDAAVAD